jgi:ribose transport system substrate-binding protein
MEQDMGVSLIATDNYEAGYKMGQYMKQFVQEDSVIGIVGHIKGTSTATEREAGFRAGLGEAQDKIVEVVFCDSSEEKAYELTCGLLEQYPRMDMVVGLNEYSAVGAARAVKAQGKTENFHMAGFDSSLEEVQLLEEGIFDAIVIQKPFNMGYLGIDTAVKAARGEKVDSYVDSGSELITRENMYTEENQKLLFPFFGSN